MRLPSADFESAVSTISPLWQSFTTIPNQPAESQEALFQFQLKALSSLARLRLLNVLSVRLRRLNPRRLEITLDLELDYMLAVVGRGCSLSVRLITGAI